MRKRSVFCLITLITALAVSAKDRPNVLFIMSDDHTAQAVGAAGAPSSEMVAR